jgi:hypothetical protein
VGDYLAWEAKQVDKRLAQLEKAREKAAASRQRRREEESQRKWDGLRQDLHLSRRQETLLRAVDGKRLTVAAAVGAVYRVKWERLSKKQRLRCRGKLGVLLHAINLKLEAVDHGQRVSVCNGKLYIVSKTRWKKPPTVQSAQRLAAAKRPGDSGSAVSRCAEFLRSLFVKYESYSDDGWLPVSLLNGDACWEGYRLGTIRNAGKRLRLNRKRVGYGGKGGWLVSLPPPRKPAKT